MPHTRNMYRFILVIRWARSPWCSYYIPNCDIIPWPVTSGSCVLSHKSHFTNPSKRTCLRQTGDRKILPLWTINSIGLIPTKSSSSGSVLVSKMSRTWKLIFLIYKPRPTKYTFLQYDGKMNDNRWTPGLALSVHSQAVIHQVRHPLFNLPIILTRSKTAGGPSSWVQTSSRSSQITRQIPFSGCGMWLR